MRVFMSEQIEFKGRYLFEQDGKVAEGVREIAKDSS